MIFVKLWLKLSKFKPTISKLWLSYLGWTYKWYKQALFCRTYLTHSLSEATMCPAALSRISTQIVDSSQVSERWTLQNQPKLIIKTTKCWEKKTIRDLEKDCPKQNHDLLFWLVSSKTKFPKLIKSSWSVICLVCSIFQYCISRKRLNHFEGFQFLDTDKTIHKTNFTNLNGALSSYQTSLPCSLHSEVGSCVWMGNSRKPTVLHQPYFEL